MTKQLLLMKGLSKALLCFIAALTASTSVDAQVVIKESHITLPTEYDAPITGYKYAEVDLDENISSSEQDGDGMSPIFRYMQMARILEKFSDKDKVSENGDTVFIAMDNTPTIAPVPHCGDYNEFKSYMFDKVTETESIFSKEYNGMIYLDFTVKKDGSISDITSKTHIGHVSQEFIDAATKVIKEMPNWTPATKDGKPIEVKCMLAINASCHIPLSDNLAKNVEGIYKLTKIGREDGSVIDSPFDQYIISADGYHLDLTITPPAYKHDVMSIILTRKAHDVDLSETEPAVEPAKEEWLANPPVPKVYDIDKKGFTMKWFNNFKRYGGGPYNSWITETWKRDKSSKAFKTIMEVLKTKATEDNPMLGIWRCKGTNFYKIYGKDHCIILWNNAGKWTLKKFSGTMNGNVRKVEYIHKNLTMEAGSPCMIEWVDDNNFRLHYRDSESSIGQEDSWFERSNKLKLTVEEWERIDAESNDNVYEIINDIINSK